MIARTIIKLLHTLFFLFCLTAISTLKAQSYTAPFYKNSSYEQNIPTPDETLGFALGERPARYHEIVAYFKELAEASPFVQLVEAGASQENRKLYYVLISSEENITRLAQIKDDIANLADPRKTNSASSIKKIINQSPAIAWLMYSIHGDELSGADASMQVAYQLAAGLDDLTKKLRKELVVGIYPMENPDGRERFLAKMQQWRGNVPNSDVQSIHHTGDWPWGRTNHYLFDLNRDWFILSQPESRSRVKAIREWNPQMVVDAHEMGSYDSFLFPPAREPINPHFKSITKKWGMIFSDDQARAFDQYGWSYYTREWLDDWYPGYGSSWPFLLGAVGILYEQASTDGSPVKRPDGTLLTYREAIHHQMISSIANLSTAANNREALLNDFYLMKKRALSSPQKSGTKAYYIIPGDNAARVYRLLERLMFPGIEIEVATADFKAKGLRSYWDQKPVNRTLPKGTYLIRTAQPLSPLIDAILEFDPRMTTKFLKSERKSLEKGEGTRMYEVSAWSMLLAYGLEAYASNFTPAAKTERLQRLPDISGRVINGQPTYGFIIDYRDDRAVDALLKLFNKDYKVRVAQENFQVEDHKFPQGSLLLRINENPASLAEGLAEISKETAIDVFGVNTARCQTGPDLGGNEFRLLTIPKIAMLAGPSISSYNFGALWYLLDYELKLRFSIINENNFNRTDLRKYNVLILPSSGRYKRVLGAGGKKKLKSWISDGGTLIGVANAAAFLADSSSGLSKVKLRRQALKELNIYQKAFTREKMAGKTVIDSLAIWEGSGKNAEEGKDPKSAKIDIKKLKEKDRRQRLYMPRGAITYIHLDKNHWLSFGVGKRVPAIFYSSYAYLAQRPVQTVGRFSEASSIRLSGLLWPEAKERWENSAYLTRESYGMGQIILFAGEPNFRSYFYGTGRLIINSMLLGPGMGTRQPVEW